MNRPCGLRRLRPASASRAAPPGFLLDVGDRGGEHGSIGVARANGVDRHALRRQLDGEGAGEADHAVLGRAVGRHVRVAFEAGRRRDEDDATACVAIVFAQEIGQRGLCGQKGAGQIDGDHPLPLRQIGPTERRALRRAGVGDDDVDWAMRAPCGLRHRQRFCLAGDIGDDGLGARQPGGKRLERLRATAGNRDGGAGGCQRLGDGGADAGAAARDQRMPAVERAHHTLSAWASARALSRYN